MNAAIDLGNTQAKVGIFSDGELLRTFTSQVYSDIIGQLQEAKVTCLIVSNVGKVQLSLVQELRKHFEVWVLNYQTPIPIQNRYQTPETLGMDRLAAVIGAQKLFPDQANLVIDLGTCITYDFITQSGEYIGGSISPGLQMRAKAMNTFTANLPLVKLENETPLIGTNTETCLKSGAINGVKYETDGIIHAYQERFGLFNTVLCGGDAKFFETQLKASIFVCQDIVLVGLDAVLQYNLSKASTSK